MALVPERESCGYTFRKDLTIDFDRLIAIMLGRFRMTVPDCIDEYKKLGGSVFGKPRFFTELRFPFLTSRKKYDAEKLQRVFKEVTTRRNQQPTNETLFITFPTDHDLCKT